MNRFSLSIGALSYAGVVALALSQLVIYAPSTIVLPLELLTALGIGMTIRGLVDRGHVGFYTAGAFMALGFILGALGVFGWGSSSIQYAHTTDVCGYSKIFPNDPYAQWACPQVPSAFFVMWTLAASLVIPSLLFLAVPSLEIHRKQKSRTTVE